MIPGVLIRVPVVVVTLLRCGRSVEPLSSTGLGSSFLVQTLPIYHHNFANSEGASQDEHIPSEKYDGMADLNPFKQGFVEPVESQ